MHDVPLEQQVCAARRPQQPKKKERGVLLVVLLTAAMMFVEIGVGYATHSMALLADGWHMATHVGALGLASLAYTMSRRYAAHRAFAFGTGKLLSIAGYTSAVLLGLAALMMVVESTERILFPAPIDFVRSLPVAVVGLLVNLASVFLLHAHDDDGHGDIHEHAHHGHNHHRGSSHAHHDHNHQAAFMHVVADTFTSALAIAALLAGRYLSWSWLDALSGMVGGLVILKWAVGLGRSAALELLDVTPSAGLEQTIRSTLEALDDVRVHDLHVWSLGAGANSCIVTLVSAAPRESHWYRARLAQLPLAHLTIEVQRCRHGDDQPGQTGPREGHIVCAAP